MLCVSCVEFAVQTNRRQLSSDECAAVMWELNGGVNVVNSGTRLGHEGRRNVTFCHVSCNVANGRYTLRYDTIRYDTVD